MPEMEDALRLISNERLKMEIFKMNAKKLPEKMRKKVMDMIEDIETHFDQAEAKRTAKSSPLLLTDSSFGKRNIDHFADSDTETETKTVEAPKKKKRGFKVTLNPLP
tara:strand:+ start:388 stop:708 length:321 start_codon:yes stop_codon:yes gene_type:complete